MKGKCFVCKLSELLAKKVPIICQQNLYKLKVEIPKTIILLIKLKHLICGAKNL